MKTTGYLLKLFARWATLTFSLSVALFLVAGTLQLPSLRNYLVTFSALLLATMLGIDPGLPKERSRRSERIGTPGRFAASVSFLATLTVAALEVGRFHWLRPVPVAMRETSLLLFAAALTLETWAMVVNPFFSPDIRLQSERGHRLITCGPYRAVHHPGYLAMLVAVPGSALAIGSWLALVPAAGFCLAIVKRVGAEEQFLQRNLAGYGEYMDKVRGHLFPRMNSHRHSCQNPVSNNFTSQSADSRRP